MEDYPPYPPSSNAVDSFNVNYYKNTDRLQKMEKHKIVQQSAEDGLNSDWYNKVTIARKYKKHAPEFLKFL